MKPRCNTAQCQHHALARYPWDETRLVLPAAASAILCVLTYAAFNASLGAEGMYGPFAGFVLGYVMVHWYVHARQPKSQLGRWLRREHFLHHFKDPTSRFGVSCPWLDYMFGTRPKKRSASGPHRSDVRGQRWLRREPLWRELVEP